MQGLKFCRLFLFDSKLSACCSYKHQIPIETSTSPYMYPIWLPFDKQYPIWLWYPRQDLNLHTLRHCVLSAACLPFHHSGIIIWRRALMPPQIGLLLRNAFQACPRLSRITLHRRVFFNDVFDDGGDRRCRSPFISEHSAFEAG